MLEDKHWLMLCHGLGMLSIFPFNLLGPFIVYLFKGGVVKDLNKHAFESLNFQRHRLNVGSHQHKLFDVSSGSH